MGMLRHALPPAYRPQTRPLTRGGARASSAATLCASSFSSRCLRRCATRSLACGARPASPRQTRCTCSAAAQRAIEVGAGRSSRRPVGAGLEERDSPPVERERASVIIGCELSGSDV